MSGTGTIELLRVRDALLETDETDEADASARESLLEAADSGDPTALDAADYLDDVARERPEALVPVTERLAELAADAPDARVRSSLASALSRVVAYEPAVGGWIEGALTHLVDVDDERRFESYPRAQRQAVRHGLECWVAAAAGTDLEVPEEVVVDAARFLRIADPRGLRTSVRLLERASIQGTTPAELSPPAVLAELLTAEDPRAALPAGRAVVGVATATPETFDRPGEVADALESLPSRAGPLAPDLEPDVEAAISALRRSEEGGLARG